MSKRLCQFDRREIRHTLGDIHHLVSAPKFVCLSCARSANQCTRLCKPVELPATMHQPIAPEISPSRLNITLPMWDEKTLKQFKKQQTDKKARKQIKKLIRQQKKLRKESGKIQKRLEKIAC
ncbi:hypothetical protein [Vibrio gazogenes]|uniref:Uncharacterized protein n=1 Tax=Vibrio gazogenes DSM 21264 = NBRC 103151 TaxID=1123492 RepID=A0A1M5BND2_VIBGA|nr:hypothetical protein [Vibrio gazogenes]USP13726.1 hypothetical protein MKS89_15360 [Vibrio gazogenes]SHF44039.1 hypothetical protein SAMN02745781_02268 [Vibrio gazogenes DSM 21264] [Vibrio gazogenes DSM 21264 = NBRC 103151]SJN56560.1 hypothetical protein BQ6471_02101 [Vibrio gazogenes]